MSSVVDAGSPAHPRTDVDDVSRNEAALINAQSAATYVHALVTQMRLHVERLQTRVSALQRERDAQHASLAQSRSLLQQAQQAADAQRSALRAAAARERTLADEITRLRAEKQSQEQFEFGRESLRRALLDGDLRKQVDVTIEALKGKVMVLNRDGCRFLQRKLTDIEGWRDHEHLFKTAHAEIKRIVVEVAGDPSLEPGARWTFDKALIKNVPMHSVAALRKALQSLVIGYDNLDDGQKDTLTTSMEIIQNAEYLIEIAEHCANVARERERERAAAAVAAPTLGPALAASNVSSASSGLGIPVARSASGNGLVPASQIGGMGGAARPPAPPQRAASAAASAALGGGGGPGAGAGAGAGSPGTRVPAIGRSVGHARRASSDSQTSGATLPSPRSAGGGASPR